MFNMRHYAVILEMTPPLFFAFIMQRCHEFSMNVVNLCIEANRLRKAHLQSVEPPSVQEDGEADKVAVLCYDL